MNTHDTQHVRDAVLAALAEPATAAGVAIESINGKFDLFGSGVLDSLGFVDLLLKVEQTLGHPLPLDQLDFDSLESLDGLVVQLCGFSQQSNV